MNQNQKNRNQVERTNGKSQSAQMGRAGNETVEQWWGRISPGERKLAQVLAGMMGEMTDRKRIEIRREAERVRARFIHILQQPEMGCVSAIVLPERASGGWN